ncbi:hypothetical protein GQ44DRAFT_722808 [Phaeosphaeriaceae sp. PMI808]|nr:hypothetical protein GQ44DRAFT_722808 [Phaeosphaeriaceae sp. PMI808]
MEYNDNGGGPAGRSTADVQNDTSFDAPEPGHESPEDFAAVELIMFDGPWSSEDMNTDRHTDNRVPQGIQSAFIPSITLEGRPTPLWDNTSPHFSWPHATEGMSINSQSTRDCASPHSSFNLYDASGNHKQQCNDNFGSSPVTAEDSTGSSLRPFEQPPWSIYSLTRQQLSRHSFVNNPSVLGHNYPPAIPAWSGSSSSSTLVDTRISISSFKPTTSHGLSYRNIVVPDPQMGISQGQDGSIFKPTVSSSSYVFRHPTSSPGSRNGKRFVENEAHTRRPYTHYLSVHPEPIVSHNAPSSPTSDLSETPADEPDVLLCLKDGCKKMFQGKYRRGTLHRHMRLKHNNEQEREYKCEAHGCNKVFKRQDARLKHHRSKHLELGCPGPLRRYR